MNLEELEQVTGFVNLCESDPDQGLRVIDSLIQENPQFENSSLMRFAKALAYGSKGLFMPLRYSPNINLGSAGPDEIRGRLGITDRHLDHLEAALREIANIQETDPSFIGSVIAEGDRIGEAKVDGIAIALERCRPGRVQAILGKTKLLYFGVTRVGKHQAYTISDDEARVFFEVPFACERIAKSALLAGDGKDSAGRRYVSVALISEPEIFNVNEEQNPWVGTVCFFDDGSYTSGLSPPDSTEKPRKSNLSALWILGLLTLLGVLAVGLFKSQPSSRPTSLESAGLHAEVTATSLNVRAGPSTRFRVINTVGRGQRLNVVRCEGSWCLIKVASAANGRG